MVSRSSSSHEVTGSMIRSPEIGPSGAGTAVSSEQQQVPIGSVAIVSRYFDAPFAQLFQKNSYPSAWL
jgi:hypothetical protein